MTATVMSPTLMTATKMTGHEPDILAKLKTFWELKRGTLNVSQNVQAFNSQKQNIRAIYVYYALVELYNSHTMQMIQVLNKN